MNPPLGAIAHIDTSALVHNLSRVRASAPNSRVLAVIKADAYGHGLLNVARALRDADGFAVARLVEAQALRAAGMTQRIVLLAGVHDADEFRLVAQLAIDIVVHHRAQVELLEQAPPGVRLNVWLKVDSGMHRLGVPPAAVAELHARLSRCAALGEPLRVMSHLADADELDSDTTAQQIDTVYECTAGLNAELSIANSAGVLAWPGAHTQWVRPGIMLYGISPFARHTGLDHALRPAMTLSTRVFAINDISKDSPIGYGGTYTTPEAMAIGAAAVGYADGYPRNLPNGTRVLVDGQSVPIVGRVSMDTITLDLRHHDAARIGSKVVLWGDFLPIETVASGAGTIAYELLCRVGSRVPRVLVSA
jgi:alanine racemase